MANIMNFFQTVMTSFSTFGSWFFTTKIVNFGGYVLYPWEIFTFVGLTILLLVHAIRLFI